MIIGLCTYRSFKLTAVTFICSLVYAVLALFQIVPSLFYFSPAGNAFMFFVGSLAYFMGPALQLGSRTIAAGAVSYVLSMYILPASVPASAYFEQASIPHACLFVSSFAMAAILLGMPNVQFIRNRPAIIRASRFLGQLSYPVFLLHTAAAIPVLALLGDTTPGGSGLMFCGSFAITLVLSIMVIATVENPIERIRARVRGAALRRAAPQSIEEEVASSFAMLSPKSIGVGLACGAVVYWSAMFGTDYINTIARDRQRVADAHALRSALERYRDQFGRYPSPFEDVNIYSLKAELVDRAFLSFIPEDPLWAATGKQYRYISHDGQAYGLWIHLEYAQGDIPAGGSCMTGVGHAGTDWYAGAPELNGRQPLECPF